MRTRTTRTHYKTQSVSLFVVQSMHARPFLFFAFKESQESKSYIIYSYTLLQYNPQCI